MAKLLKVPPTKSTLLRLRKQVDFLQAGYELLERKRELLTRLVYERLADYREIRKEAHTILKDAYLWLGLTHLRMGSRMLEQVCVGLPPVLSVHVLPRSSLGVEYPFIWYREDREWGAYDGLFEENMVVCVESYTGAEGGKEGVKLEIQCLITPDGARHLALSGTRMLAPAGGNYYEFTTDSE